MNNRDDLIITMYKNGIGIGKIANVFKITELEVNQTLFKNGIDRTDYIYADRDEKIITMYKQGKKVVRIAEALNVNRHTVVAVLKRSGDYKGNAYAPNNSPEKEERNTKIIEYYNSGMSLKQVGEKVGLTPGGVCKVLRDLGIPRRPQHMKGHSLGTTKNRKHKFDYDFFSSIDTEGKAYWLGFLYADGYVNYNGLITLGLKQSDKEHLEKFRRAISANDTSIKNRKETKSVHLTLNSVKAARDLSRLGCWQKKSLTLSFPSAEQVPQSLIHHFMRGYFDVDGCICAYDKYRITFSVLGTKDFLDCYEEILLKNALGDREPNKRRHSKTWNINTQAITYGGRLQAIKIYNFLYKDATVYLERKKEIFNQLPSCLGTKLQKS